MPYTISVIIPIYNIEKYLNECVDSVLNQTILPSEIILVNDGSTDGSLTICKTYENAYSHLIKIINKENGGASSARNAGIRAATGEYCYFIDGDDRIHPDTLKSFSDLLEEYGELDYIDGRMSYFYDGTNELRPQNWYLDNRWETVPIDGQHAFCTLLKHNGMIALGIRGLYRRQFLLDNDLFLLNLKCAEDEEWVPRVFANAKKVVGNDKPYYQYRENRPNSLMTIQRSLSVSLAALDVYDGMCTLAKSENSSAEFRKALLFEAGKRYYWTVTACTSQMQGDDYTSFLNRAARSSYLAHYYKPKTLKQFFWKQVVRFSGIKLWYRTRACFRKKR